MRPCFASSTSGDSPNGQWIGLARELTRAERPTHPVPELHELFFGSKATRQAIDGLLAMRKGETVAHGATGDEAELEAVLSQRIPQLCILLAALAPLWDRACLLQPLASGSPREAWRLVGVTPPRGRWRRQAMQDDEVAASQLVLADREGRPVLAVAPFLRLMRPSPEATEEIFFLDGSVRRKARYIALPSMAERRDPDVWRLLDTLLAEAQPQQQAADPAERPYRGLSSFTEADAALFFGREQQSEALANRIRRHPLVTVTGASGSGKSSLLHAGTLPRLSDFRVVSLRPGADPMASLSWALSFLGSPSGPLHTQVLSHCQATGTQLVLVVDQAEELFTLCQDESARLRFAAQLVALAAVPDGPTRVVLSLREDFFARLATLAPLEGQYTRQVEVVVAPDAESLHRILVEPARAFGYAFEDGLAERMVSEVRGESAALALLQFCADQLWEVRDRSWKRLTGDAYDALGGVAGALAGHADTVVAKLPVSQHR